MILKERHTGWKLKGKVPFKWIFLGLLAVLLLGFLTYIPRSKYSVRIENTIFCGAEELVHDGSKIMFQGKGALFENAEGQSSDYARTGNFSSKTDSSQQYGMFYMLKDANPGERYKVTVWRYGFKLQGSRLVVSINNPGGEAFYQREDKAIEVDEKEWERLELTFQVPAYYQKQGIRIYPMGGDSPVYFDDLSIERMLVDESIDFAKLDTNTAQLSLKIDDVRMNKLKKRRQHILNTGIYFAQDDDWVKAKIVEPEDELGVKLRFKGDWMDHIKFEKWSFRIKVKEPNAWQRMTSFSIQRPENRFFLTEWIYHQFLAREDVLCPRYDFVEVTLNGEEKGIYAFEEHFEKQLPEFRARREGPILKFSEDGVWNARKRSLDIEREGREIEKELNSFESSVVLPFQESKTLISPALAGQFKQAQSLMQQYKLGQTPVSDIFDLDKLAKYYAITDISQAFHSTIWHNQRFYFNPVIGKLEPIAYDGYTESGIFGLGGGQPILGADINRLSSDFGDELLRQHMLDTAFVKKYHYYLDAFSKKSYMDNFWLDMEGKYKGRLYRLRKEYPNYNFGPARMKQQAIRVQSLMHPLDDNSLRVYRSSKEGDKTLYRLSNHHILPLEVLGFGTKTKMNLPLDAPTFIWPFEREKLPTYEKLTGPSTANYVFFRLPGIDKTYKSKIIAWPQEYAQIPAQEVFKDIDLASHSLWKLDGNKLIVQPGLHRIENDLIVPAGYEVHFLPGSQLDFVKGSKFLSRSAVKIAGEAEQPVRIFSSDKSAKGFTVLQTDQLSVVQYLSFEDFGALEEGAWTLTGAMTFYEADVHIDHISVLNNRSEDAINLIRSKITVLNSVINTTQSDGLDVDFCIGEIRGLTCINTGNDGMDFSGSRVNLWNVSVKSPGDKGISVGEESFVIIHSAEITGARLGLASKDLSTAEVKQILMKDCNIAFSAYQKKPEFGGAKILVEKFEGKDINYLHLIEKGSELKLRGKIAETL